MLISICKSRVNITRRTNKAVSSTAVASSISITTTPKIACPINFIFSNSQTGVITVTGTLNGSPQTETINISSNKVVGGVKSFSSITTVALDSAIVSAGGTVLVKYIGSDGGSVSSETSVVTDYPIQIDRGKQDFFVPESGSNPVENAKALLPYTENFTPQDGDILTIDNVSSEKFLVSGIPFIEQIGFMSYWHLQLQLYENE
jgi:hypothetical protein